MFSSGITSWAAAKRYAETHGTEGMVLLFADTLIEDEDNYRFLYESAANIGAPLVIIRDGRTPWQVMRDRRIIGNSRIDPCSMVLKRELLDKWRDRVCDPEKTDIVLGILWDESHRIDRVRSRTAPWNYLAPLCDKPWISKNECLEWAAREGVRPPRMYNMGFPHANCGGFCIKAGQATFKLLLKNFPERYAAHEEEERSMRELVGNHSVMRCRRGGTSKVLTMEDFRKRVEAEEQIDETDIGGCGCALPL
jgi:3'-phosphoadenosine 5'-phosphosulfate sulfotransferase (PAPS reductase)/FAD synthetase